MKVELEIISDRFPTEADASKSGMVFVIVDGVWSIWHWHNVRWHWHNVQAGMQWARIPAPKPPIDTSLAESIERVISDMQEVMAYDPYAMSKVGEELYKDDIYRVIEAARKWDESQRNGVTSTSHCKPNSDPDGVGEGWRRCSMNEGEQWSDYGTD